jgi:hypothetical protein
MFVTVLICFLMVGAASNIICVTMKIRVNEQRAEGQQLSWWSHDFREVNRMYREHHPNSILPTLDRYLSYLLYALFAAALLTGTRG